MRRDLVTATFGIGFLVLVGLLWWEGDRQHFTLLAPGISYDPLFFPRLLLALGGLCAAAITALGLLRPHVAHGELRWGLWLALTTLVGGYFWAMSQIGFLTSTTIFVILFGAVLGYRRWPALIGFAVVTSAVVWYVFTAVLQVPLPVAPWLGGLV